MAGWAPEDFSHKPASFLEVKQKESMDVYKFFFECCYRWLRPRGRLIMHVGRTASCDMAKELTSRAKENFDVIYSFDEDVSRREKFGLKDQGATTSHQYVFFRSLK